MVTKQLHRVTLEKVEGLTPVIEGVRGAREHRALIKSAPLSHPMAVVLNCDKWIGKELGEAKTK